MNKEKIDIIYIYIILPANANFVKFFPHQVKQKGKPFEKVNIAQVIRVELHMSSCSLSYVLYYFLTYYPPKTLVINMIMILYFIYRGSNSISIKKKRNPKTCKQR